MFLVTEVNRMGNTQANDRFNFINPVEKQENNELLSLRNQLKELEAWPTAGDEFLNLIPEFNRHSPPVTESDNEWLPQVVQDSLKGVDIGFQYPSFFQKLLMNPHLRRLFMKELRTALEQ